MMLPVSHNFPFIADLMISCVSLPFPLLSSPSRLLLFLARVYLRPSAIQFLSALCRYVIHIDKELREKAANTLHVLMVRCAIYHCS